ncbi:DUF5020 family protein [Mucilaginibacter celer]|uniref:DUF5020 family protein n=1 Tax=Mucilaginibacter celer TaxID=2305508 RepID=A0A494VS98_9SPHI|nr:DUF5020 family protein [Mucilaginibacter celer]AYL96270.1 DUF5020 family protein [Mucilaginibacter celer]
MKFRIIIILCFLVKGTLAQNLQLHYDLRHTVDPGRNSKNFPSLYFEYFKSMKKPGDSALVKPGAFFLKVQTDLQGADNNIGKSFIQVSQSFKFWKPDVFLSVQYSGGLGVTEPKHYSYYITNAFSLGPAYGFAWAGVYFSTSLSYTYNALEKPSYDFMYSFYWGKGFFNYKLEFKGDFEVYTINRNQGDDFTRNLRGKRLSFFGEPQLWYNINNTVGVGARLNMFYHVVTTEDVFQNYPTIAVKVKL